MTPTALTSAPAHASVFVALTAAYRKWRAARQRQAAFQKLDAHSLRDIGLTPKEILKLSDQHTARNISDDLYRVTLHASGLR